MFLLIKKYFLFLLLLTFSLAFTSCDEGLAGEDDLAPEIETEGEMPELTFKSLPPEDEATMDPVQLRLRRPCFRFEFPLEIGLGDRTVVTIENALQLRRTVMRIRTNNLRANFIYPFNVNLADGSQVTVESFPTFRRLVRACRDLDRPEANPCLTINYPIEVNLRDSVLAIGNRRQLIAAQRRQATIVFPIDLTITESGETITANTLRELRDLRQDCLNQGEDDDRGRGCYRVMYPIDLNIGRSTVTVVDRLNWARVVRNVPRGVSISLVYPITLQEVDSEETLIINSRDEWADAREACELGE